MLIFRELHKLWPGFIMMPFISLPWVRTDGLLETLVSSNVFRLFAANSVILAACWTYLLYSDPPYLFPTTNHREKDHEEEMDYCIECTEKYSLNGESSAKQQRLKKPRGCHHCYTCHACVVGYDHHCSWIGNCVGAGNMKAFQIFLVLQIMYFTLYFANSWDQIIGQMEEMESAPTMTLPWVYMRDFMASFHSLVNFAMFAGLIFTLHVSFNTFLGKRSAHTEFSA
eukprot:TRINITY_DN12337_c0_g1_i2.p1 TRINITY_DN12337_c0_g1~~TRINITY_DN12337_c0_g1_i2.p1  ORF type:complete len:226 (+),score=35.86 TRINITY_DN12337_c0_g1_i2:43-720(+)